MTKEDREAYRKTPEYFHDKKLAYSRMRGDMDGGKADKKAFEMKAKRESGAIQQG